mmetsp:Transcript_19737/g.64583  ORF Transcript_19737/g.64583 Transcript_19737/m.64583 type:complete len:210 (-) Transcript_19737:473-1102(-)
MSTRAARRPAPRRGAACRRCHTALRPRRCTRLPPRTATTKTEGTAVCPGMGRCRPATATSRRPRRSTPPTASSTRPRQTRTARAPPPRSTMRSIRPTQRSSGARAPPPPRPEPWLWLRLSPAPAPAPRSCRQLRCSPRSSGPPPSSIGQRRRRQRRRRRRRRRRGTRRREPPARRREGRWCVLQARPALRGTAAPSAAAWEHGSGRGAC